jgi:hypothetical protein
MRIATISWVIGVPMLCNGVARMPCRSAPPGL